MTTLREALEAENPQVVIRYYESDGVRDCEQCDDLYFHAVACVYPGGQHVCASCAVDSVRTRHALKVELEYVTAPWLMFAKANAMVATVLRSAETHPLPEPVAA